MEVREISSEFSFKSGETLPTAKELIKLLDALHVAYQKGETKKAGEIESQICSMAVPGIYEGYLSDDPTDLNTTFVRLVSTQRRNPKSTSADVYSFVVTLHVLEIVHVVEVRTMDLRDFLGGISRFGACDRQHNGPRFWPL